MNFIQQVNALTPTGGTALQVLMTAAFSVSAGVGTTTVFTVRAMDKKLDSVLQVLFGPPESKEADGLVRNVKDHTAALDYHRKLLDAQNLAMADLTDEVRSVKATCAATHRRRDVP